MNINKVKKIPIENKQKNRYVVFSCDSRECGKGIGRDEALLGTTHIYSEELNCFVCLNCGKEVKNND